jgi:hypothetical protein
MKALEDITTLRSKLALLRSELIRKQVHTGPGSATPRELTVARFKTEFAKYHEFIIDNAKEIGKQLLSDGEGMGASTILNDAIRFGHIDVVLFLINNGVDVNKPNVGPNGEVTNSPLHLAAMASVVLPKKAPGKLLQTNSDLEAQMAANATNAALQGIEDSTRADHGLNAAGRLQVVQVLLEKGANPLAKNSDGLTPDQVETKDEQITQLLTKAKEEKIELRKKLRETLDDLIREDITDETTEEHQRKIE